MKIIDGKDMILGRLASYAAKEALKGEEIAILNCQDVIITGNESYTKKDFEARRGRVGSTQKGPKVSRMSDRIVKRTVRGMLPNYRVGRGREAFKRIRCYVGIPENFEKSDKIVLESKTGLKSKKMAVGEIFK
jgi:large subunit ribosomal protein L13